MNILIVGPHPDDQELGMGGSIAKFIEQGHDVLLLDMTNGEPTPHGNPETRAKEAAAAAEILGVKRVCIDLPNRFIQHTIEARHKVAGVIREHRAEIVFTPYFEDAHPDHIATTRIVEDARFDAKLTKIDLPGEPIYPRWLFYYYCTHLRHVANPCFLIDITGYEQRKHDSIVAYETQFVIPEKNRRIVEWIDAANRYFGSRIGVQSAEPFFTKEPVGLSGVGELAGINEESVQCARRQQRREPLRAASGDWGILRDPEVRAARLARIDEPHVRPLNELVARLRIAERIEHPDHVPYIDPNCGGTNAPILMLVESPGPATLKSGFLSLDNRDQSAREVAEIIGELGIEQNELVYWNIVPWHIPQEEKPQQLNEEVIGRGVRWLERFLACCPHLRCVLTMGKHATQGWDRLLSQLPEARRLHHIRCPHPSPQTIRTRKDVDVREQIKQAFRIAAEFCH